MGKEGNEQQKNALVDFLYKDINLINSLYSQIFNGALNSIVKTETSADMSTSEANLGIGFAGAKFSSNETMNQAITSNINPMDAIILDLMEALEIKNYDFDEENIGSIVAVKGNLIFRDYKVINDLIPLISDFKIVPELSQPLNPNAKGKDKENSLGKMIQKMISIIPFGLEFEILTEDGENITAIIQDEFLTIKPNDLIRAYGSKLPSQWTTVGIIDKIQETTHKSKSQFKSGIDDLSNLYYATINENGCKYVIKPIVVYRHI